MLNTMVYVDLAIHGILFLGCKDFLQGFSGCFFFFEVEIKIAWLEAM